MEHAGEKTQFAAGSKELIEQLVEENAGWAASIARSVARAWNLDWQLDGLDGGAYEALLFCASRYDPLRGVPFRAYARRRIHESSTHEARKSKSWRRSVGANSEAEQTAREISAKLFELFPELRDGLLPDVEDDSDTISVRNAIRQLLTSANMLVSGSTWGATDPELAVDHRNIVGLLSELDRLHQQIIWEIYYQGASMRQVAAEWDVDELAIIREHRQILEHLQTVLAGRKPRSRGLKIRPVLRPIAQQLKNKESSGPFSDLFTSSGSIAVPLALLLAVAFHAFIYAESLSQTHRSNLGQSKTFNKLIHAECREILYG